jgi:hypothetical protein
VEATVHALVVLDIKENPDLLEQYTTAKIYLVLLGEAILAVAVEVKVGTIRHVLIVVIIVIFHRLVIKLIIIVYVVVRVQLE